MSITPIRNPLPGEHVVALSPENAAEAATAWLARPNVFAGRALTAPTLQKRQRWEAGRIALRGQSLTQGVDNGLEVGHELVKPADGSAQYVRLVVAAGLAITAGGEDVALAQPAHIDLLRLPVYAEPSVEGSGSGGKDEGNDGVGTVPVNDKGEVILPPGNPQKGGKRLRARTILTRDLGTLFHDKPNAIERIGVLVLQPVEADRLGEFDPADPCELAPCGATGDDELAFEDWRVADGVRAVWYAWPNEWRPLPVPGIAFRNRLAWTIFRAERALAQDELLPWEELGVPVALIALDQNLKPLFIDRASVVRDGGRSRDPRLAFRAGQACADTRRAALHQAQIEQLAEELAAIGGTTPDELRKGFATLPPTGLLPVDVLDFGPLPLNDVTEDLVSKFFPAEFELDAAPVPMESLDLAIREAAPLAPVDMNVADRIRVLVPVPQAVFEPRLLIEEVIDPEFNATLQRFLLARARALAARDGLRRKISELVRLATGRALPVPAPEDDPGALEKESTVLWGTPSQVGGHVSGIGQGLRQHSFTIAAGGTLPVLAGESMYAWVYLDPDNPPRVLMLQWSVGAGPAAFDHRAYWCAAGDKYLVGGADSDNTPARRYIAALPTAGAWTRVTVPASQVGLNGQTVNGMAFTLYDGRAAYGATGKVVNNSDQVWFSNVLPAGAAAPAPSITEEAWTVLMPNDLNAPFEPNFGLDLVGLNNEPFGRSGDLDELMKDALLAQIVNEAGVLTANERAELGTRGLEGFIKFLRSRADRADDIVDYGFVKVQTDTYRIRQLMLGTTNATRLAVSPALATIAQADTAAASQQRIATFFEELKPKAITPPPAAKPIPVKTLIKPVTTIVRGGTSGPYVPISRQKAVNLNIGTQKVLAGIGVATAFTPKTVVNANPLVGKATIRTTTIAERLQAPKAVEAKNYVTATRHDAVQAILRLAQQLKKEDGNVLPGLFLGINVYGIEGDLFLHPDPNVVGDDKRRTVAFKDFLDKPTLIEDMLSVPDWAADEAAQFSDSADIADATVAFLRQMEGRIELYRNAAAAAERVLEAMREDTDGARRALAAWDEHLAEARQDVSVARALIAEETARLDAINKRRADVLKKEVRFLAYIRPREVHNLAEAPLRTVDPGLIDAPVPACLAEHADVPDELHDVLAEVREAPVAWFPQAPRLIEKLDRVDLLVRAMQGAQARGAAYAMKPPPLAVSQQATAVRNAIAHVQTRTRQAVGETRQLVANVNLAQLASLSWQGARAQVEQVVSLGDLIDGEHGRGEIAKKAAELFDRTSRVAGCLHAEFSAVLPSIRLDWAEALSQFDEAPNLRDLSVLARWSEIEFIDRKQMQSYADFLFDQVDARVAAAESLMNDVVRMCLLLAADAPIGRILAGRLPRPAVARPGARIPLTAFDAGKLRVGMHALVYRGDEVVARAVVEDIGSEISARVVYTQKAEESLDVLSRVQFADAAQVTVKRPPAARTKTLVK